MQNLMNISLPTASLDNRLLAAGIKAGDLAKTKEAAESFEAFFMTRMMETMFEGISTDGMFGGGHAEKIYRSLLLDEYGKEMAKVGSIGVKDYVMQAVLQLQEAASNGSRGN